MSQKHENHHDGVPVSQAIWRKRLFLPAIAKKKLFSPMHTALSRFSPSNAISQSKHTVLSSLRKKIDAIRNKTENSRVPS